MTDNKEHMLDLCFEIEGLLALMLKRENETPEKVESLLKQKIAELSELSGVCQCAPDADVNEIAQSAELEEKEDSEGMVEAAENSTASEASTANVFAPEEPEGAEDLPVDSAFSEETEVIEPADDDTSGSNDNLEPISLTLNDKFRFRRELFGNNAAELSDALDVVNAVSSQAELDDYFYNDLCWDPENPDVKDFMALASARFKK